MAAVKAAYRGQQEFWRTSSIITRKSERSVTALSTRAVRSRFRSKSTRLKPAKLGVMHYAIA